MASSASGMVSGSAARRVLLIEDNEDDQFTVRRAVKRFDPDVALEVASDGEEALEKIRRLADEGALPKLILLDLKLPKVDGLVVLRQLRADPRYDWVPVVAFRTPENPALTGCHSLGISSFLLKRVDFDSYQADLDQTLRYWLSVNSSA